MTWAGAARSLEEQDAGSWQPVRCGEVFGEGEGRKS